MIRYFLLVSIILLSQTIRAQQYELQFFDTDAQEHFRGLSIVNDSIAWLAGSGGWTGMTKDAGKTWSFHLVHDFDEEDFRSIYAFDEKRAVMCNAGSPALILYTENAGLEWKVLYRDEREEAFFDGVDFWDLERGIVYGDPINGRMSLMYTEEGPNTWKSLPEESRPKTFEGEASFAASGSGIRCYDNGRVMMSTGGIKSRLWISEDYGLHWDEISVPIVKGSKSTGIYSHHFKTAQYGIVVGGDYTKVDSIGDHIFITEDGGKSWTAPKIPTRGYRECIEHIEESTWMSAGPNGIDISYDDGKVWQALSDETGFHVLRKSRSGSFIMAAGANGKICAIRKTQGSKE